MKKYQLIREMIQIELLYQTRQKLLKENKYKLLKEIEDDDLNIDDESLYKPEDEETIDAATNADTEKKAEEPKVKEPNEIKVEDKNTGDLLKNLFTNSDNKNISLEILQGILNAEKSNNPDEHQNDLKRKIFEYYGKSKNLDNPQCLSIYKNIYAKKNDSEYLTSLLEFKFDAYSAGDIDTLISDLNSTFITKINGNSFLKDLYLNNTSSGRGGVGKGEFLILSFIKGSKSGGTKQHDIIADDAEYEVKQGKGEKSEEGSTQNVIKFNTNIRIRTDVAAMKDKLITDLNRFFNRFVASTKHMDQIMNLSSQYESSFIYNNYISPTDSKGTMAKALTNDNLNYLIRDEKIENDEFYDKKGAYYPAAIFPTIAAVLSGEHKGKTFINPTDSENTGSLTKDFQFGHDMEVLKPIIDYISGRKKTQLTAKTFDLNNDEKFSDATLQKLKGIYLKFNKTSANKYYDFVNVIDTNNDNPDNPLNSKNKIKKDPANHRVVNCLTFLNRLKELSDKENPIKNNQIITYISSTSLKTWLNNYFRPVIKEYKNALGFYKHMLTEILNATANSQAVKFDLIQTLEKNQEKSMTNYLKYKKLGSEENLKQLLDYKVFLDFYKGLSFNDEVVIDIKYYDSNNRLKNRKQIINTINDEFQVLKPDDSAIDVKDFFSKAENDETFDLRIKNENISEAQFEDIMNAKEIFAFLNDNVDLKTADNKSQETGIKSSSTLTTTVNNNENSKNMLGLLDDIINSFLKLQDAVYQEYSNPNDKDSQNKKGGLIYIKEKAAGDGITGVSLLFNDNKKNQLMYDIDDFKSLDKFLQYISQNPNTPLIKDVNANNTLLWSSYVKNSDYVLTALLDLKKTLIDNIELINQDVEEIKGLIKQLLAKNPGKKMGNIINPNA